MALLNLTYAQDAIRYVRDTMQIKAANRTLDGVSQEQFTSALEVKNSHEDVLAASIVDNDGLLALVAEAKAAVQTRIGNCQAMAALAVAYLAARQVYPLRLMGFSGGDATVPLQGTTPVTGQVVPPNTFTHRLIPGRSALKEGNAAFERVAKFEPDHAVCVIGPVTGNAANLVWGKDTVICDPWARRAYFATELADESRLIAKVTGGFTAMSCTATIAGGTDWNTTWNPPNVIQ